jgi:hypothetical protein
LSDDPSYLDVGDDDRDPDPDRYDPDATDPDGFDPIDGVPIPPGAPSGDSGDGEPPDYHRPRWRRWRDKALMWLGIVIGSILFSTILADVAGVNFFVILIPLISLAFGVRFYYKGIRAVRRSRYINPRTPQPLVENLWIDQREFEDRVLPYLGLAEHEKRINEPLKVEVVTRRHWMLLVRHIWLPALVSLLLVFAVGLFGVGKFWPGLILIVPAAIWGYFRWLFWRHSYFVSTNFRVYLIQSIPAFWWWLESPNQNIPLQHVLTVNKSDTPMGNRWGYGGVQMDSAAEHDEPFRHITHVPRHAQVVDIVNATIDARGERTGRVASP